MDLGSSNCYEIEKRSSQQCDGSVNFSAMKKLATPNPAAWRLHEIWCKISYCSVNMPAYQLRNHLRWGRLFNVVNKFHTWGKIPSSQLSEYRAIPWILSDNLISDNIFYVINGQRNYEWNIPIKHGTYLRHRFLRSRLDNISKVLRLCLWSYRYWVCLCLFIVTLTHWGRDKMAAIFQTTFSDGFSWMKMYEFRLTFHWSVFLGVPLTIFQHWFR